MTRPTMTKTLFATLAATLLAMAGCASAPETREAQHDLEADAQATLDAMMEADPTLEPLLDQAYGYVVFPEVSEGAMIAGAASGVGVVYENGRAIGYAELREGSVGAQAGGQEYAELIVIRNERTMRQIRNGTFDLRADATATAVQSGAAANAVFQDGTAVFVDLESGLMAEASIGGQNIRFQPEG
ncbi:MAG TPA: lipid-binding SYLF domain-containing protein [Sandaracinaceae bacterium LLY-WYZ-13_1]|nr:lipid-binding SYLF domain-containing protein [Sandaracinaceae bacterium LLY-WYZ-13_1]